MSNTREQKSISHKIPDRVIATTAITVYFVAPSTPAIDIISLYIVLLVLSMLSTLAIFTYRSERSYKRLLSQLERSTLNNRLKSFILRHNKTRGKKER